MDTAVKERLIGAAVLVVLVVLVVPALLRGPRPPAEPAQPVAGDTRVVEINLAGNDGVPAEVPPGPSDPAAPDEAPPAADVPVVGSEPMPAGSPPAEPGVSARQEPAPAEALPSVPSPPAAAQPAAPGWAVQVAALSKQDAADRMVAELRKKGYPAFVLEHRADGRVFYRVRVGPEAQRERAQVLARRLQDEGFKTTVVEQP